MLQQIELYITNLVTQLIQYLLGEILMTQSKLHIVVHTVNGTLVNTYSSSIEELLINKLPKDTIHKSDINALIHYGSLKTHIGNTKHCFYYQSFNAI